MTASFGTFGFLSAGTHVYEVTRVINVCCKMDGAVLQLRLISKIPVLYARVPLPEGAQARL